MKRDPSATSATSIRLRDVSADDLPVFFEQQREPKANSMANFPARDRESFMAHWAKILSDEMVGKQTILIGDQVAGNVVCFEQSGRRLVGYWLGIDYWGQGIATKALAEFLTQVKDRPLDAHVSRQNTGSVRVLRKCGFELSATEIHGDHIFTLAN